MGGGKASKPVETAQPVLPSLEQQTSFLPPVNPLLGIISREGVRGKKRDTQTTVQQRTDMHNFHPIARKAGVLGASIVKDNDGTTDGGN
jgi:hypothetical protein